MQQIESEEIYAGRDGYLGQITSLITEANNMIAEYDINNVEEGVNPFEDTEFVEQARRWDTIMRDLSDMQEEFLHKAHRRASSMMIMRGMMGFLSPVTPRLLDEERKAMEVYWNSRAAGEIRETRDLDEAFLSP